METTSVVTQVKPTGYHVLQAGLLVVPNILLKTLWLVWTAFVWIWEYLFMTESNLQRELAELEAEAALQKLNQHAAMQDAPVIQVTDMTQKRLQIDIKKSGSMEEVDEPEEVPSSAEIQVVHEREPPNLHSILKNRSMSESSECDGYGSSNSSGSPTSPRDEPFCGLRRSVSFNDRVDKTTFKPGTAVTSMTSTLKNKRKRNRKREEKRQMRLRNNSGGSEGSSGDDLDHRSTSESHSENDEEVDKSIATSISEKPEESEESIAPPNSETEKSIAPVVSSTLEEKPSREAKLVQNIKEKLSIVGKADVKDEDSDDDGENIECGVSSRTSKELHKVVDVIQSEGTNDNHERTKGVDNKEVQSVCVQEEVSSVSGDKEQQKQAAYQGGPTLQAATSQKNRADVTISPGDVITRTGVQDLLGAEQSVIKVTGEERGSGDDSGVESNTEGGGESSPGDNQVETILSWKDTPSSEHATKCSFEFSNAVMFDLDVD